MTKLRSMLAQFAILLVSLSVSVSLTTTAAAVAAAADLKPGSSDTSVVVSVAECHQWGFDPSSLSCDTCSLLFSEESSPLAQFEQECLKCCQTFRPNPVVNPEAISGSFVGRYQLAVLKYDPDSLDGYEEVKNFMNEDKADVLKEKGDKAFVLEKTQNDDHGGQMYGLMGFFGGMRTPPTIHFYKKRDVGKNTEADEEVSLRGFKREDIKDMLMTVLPS